MGGMLEATETLEHPLYGPSTPAGIYGLARLPVLDSILSGHLF